MLLTPLRSSWSHLVVALKERLSVEKIFASGFEETARKFYWTPINFLSSGYIHLPGNRPKFNFCQCFSLGCTSPALSSGCTMMSFPSWQSASSPKFNFCQWVALQLIPSFQTLWVCAASGFGCCCKYLCNIGLRNFNLDERAILCQSNSLPEDYGSDSGLR